VGRAPILDFKTHTHPAFLPDGFLPDGSSVLHTCQTSKLMAYDWQCYCGVTHQNKKGRDDQTNATNEFDGACGA